MRKENKEINATNYIKSNANATIVRVGISTISTLVILPFIIKNIGIENYSYISITSFLVSFSYVFDFGFCRSLVYLINGKGIDDRRRNEYITTINIANSVIILMIATVGIIALLCKFNILGDSIPSSDNYYMLVSICALVIMLLTIYDMYQTSMLESFFLLNYSSYSVTIRIMSMNALYFVNLLTENNLVAYVSTPVLATFISTSYNWIIIKKKIQWTFSRPSHEVIKIVLRQAFSFTKSGILTSVNNILPRVVIVYLTNNLSFIGVLDVITKITSSLINLFSSISRPFLALSRNNPQKIRSHFKKILVTYSSIGFSFWIGIFIFRQLLVDYFFNNVESINNIDYLLVIYATASLLCLLAQPFSLYIQGIGKNETLVKIIAGNIILFIISYSIMDSMDINLLMNLAITNVLVALNYFTTLMICSVKSKI